MEWQRLEYGCMFIVQITPKAIIQPHMLSEHLGPKVSKWFCDCVNRLKTTVLDTRLKTGAGLSLGGKLD